MILENPAADIFALDAVLAKFPSKKRNGQGWGARCPAHDDRKASLSISQGDDGKVLLFCHAGCSLASILKAVNLTEADLFAPHTQRMTPDRKPRGKKPRPAPDQHIEEHVDQHIEEEAPTAPGPAKKTKKRYASLAAAVDAMSRWKKNEPVSLWSYHDADGQEVGAIARWNIPGDKEILPFRRIGPDAWTCEAMPAPRPLYRLPGILASTGLVFVTEGEKAADAGLSIGLTCTTSAGGAKALAKSDWTPLGGRDKDVVILPDNDEAGRQYARDVVQDELSSFIATTVRIIELPDLPDKGDLFDFIEIRRAAGADNETIKAEILTLVVSTSCESPLAIEADWCGRKDVATFSARFRGETVRVDKLDAAFSASRWKFARATSKAVKADGCELAPADVEARLLAVLADRQKQRAAGLLDPSDDGPAESMVDLLTRLALDNAELCRDEDANAYATVQAGAHKETHALRTRGFRLWLRRLLKTETDLAAVDTAIRDAVSSIEATALFATDSQLVENVFVRLGHHMDAAGKPEIFVDLADDRWRIARITSTGWDVIDYTDCPVRFVRPRGLRPLPVPEPGGCIHELRPFLNVGDDDFTLTVAWLLGAMMKKGPYPILMLMGEQGSGKSLACRLLRDLIDPNLAAVRAEPKDPRDMVISARNSHVIAYDNLSRIRPGLSDALCRLSTGAGWASRELYSDSEETIIQVSKPILVNGISDFATRPDLLDRSIAITLDSIPEDHRRAEKDMLEAFDLARPRIVGALLTAAVIGLQTEGIVKLPTLPRMADFAIWVSACELGLTDWTAGTFMQAYAESIADTNATALDHSPIARELIRFMHLQYDAPWSGSSTELLDALTAAASDVTRDRTWPRDGTRMSAAIRRIAPNLRAVGYEIAFARTMTGRAITITRVQERIHDGLFDDRQDRKTTAIRCSGDIRPDA